MIVFKNLYKFNFLAIIKALVQRISSVNLKRKNEILRRLQNDDVDFLQAVSHEGFSPKDLLYRK